MDENEAHTATPEIHPPGGLLTTLVQGESDPNRHLPVFDFAILNVATGLEYFEPAQIVQRIRSSLYSTADSVVAADGRGSGQLDKPVDMITHTRVLPLMAAR